MLKLIRTHKTTSTLLALVLVFNITVAALCGKSQVITVRALLRSSPILTNRLVSLGRITQAQADGAIKDFTDGADVALTLSENLSTATTPREKYNAAHTAFQGWTAIYNRGNFGVHKDIQDVASIASGIFEFIDAYYGDKAGVTSHADVGADGLSEGEFKDALDQKIKELEQALKK